MLAWIWNYVNTKWAVYFLTKQSYGSSTLENVHLKVLLYVQSNLKISSNLKENFTIFKSFAIPTDIDDASKILPLFSWVKNNSRFSSETKHEDSIKSVLLLTWMEEGRPIQGMFPE